MSFTSVNLCFFFIRTLELLEIIYYNFQFDIVSNGLKQTETCKRNKNPKEKKTVNNYNKTENTINK